MQLILMASRISGETGEGMNQMGSQARHFGPVHRNLVSVVFHQDDVRGFEG